ncbi:MAG: site-2 protease family protein [Patescibacteria group bacterium]
MDLNVVLSLIILIMSVVVHEVAHGHMANYLGDPTARLQGRLTLNPLKHLDPVGSFAVPLITWFSGGFVFGWAKPVPYNPYNLQKGRWSEAYVAIAGPLSNLLLAFVFGLLVRFVPAVFPSSLIGVFALIVLVNIGLAIFNLIPIPPLDGSKILFALLPPHLAHVRHFLERYGFVVVLFFVLFLWQILTPIVGFLFNLFTGVTLP